MPFCKKLHVAVIFSLTVGVFLTATACRSTSNDQAESDRNEAGLRADGQADVVGEYVRSNMIRRGAPGAAVAVVQDGQIVYEKGFGVQSTKTGKPVTSESLFRLGSTAKLVTAATLLSLLNENEISLDTPIKNYAPELDAGISDLTAHQILSHTAGIIDYAPMQGPGDPATLHEQINSWTDEILFTKPEDIFSYSNPGYWLAGYLIEELSGSYFNEAAKTQVLLPVGAETATFDPREVNPDLLADAHRQGKRGQAELFDESFNHAGTWPSGSLYISAHGFAQIMLALMDHEQSDDAQMISKNVPELQFQAHASIPLPAGVEYGYGVFREVWDDGVEIFYHVGTRRGYGSIFLMVPEMRFAVVVLCNLDTTVLKPAAMNILKEYLGLVEPEAPELPQYILSESEFEPYLGIYHNTDEMEIKLYNFKPAFWAPEGGQFFFKMGKMKMPVYQTAPNQFHTGFADFILVPDEQGKIEYLFGEYHALKKIP
jgi:CubicO group peptidase (beta-lactamase class C family)